jgi:hypothetical protein
VTAEVAILNKSAVALAADSAVTAEIDSAEGEHKEKIYNTVNKLFALCRRRPVGIMVYGSSDFMGVPWESIIKIYRDKYPTLSKPRLRDYANHFIRFLVCCSLNNLNKW